jgi:hypothetical protein
MNRKGWTRLSRPGDKCGTHWLHEASGWRLRHCGHPTANWPYYLVEPTKGETVVSFNGLGFKKLEVCMQVVEDVLSGSFKVVDLGPESCLTINATTMGKPVPEDMP